MGPTGGREILDADVMCMLPGLHSEAGGFRAYISPAHKRKASEIATVSEVPLNRAGSQALARNSTAAPSPADCTEVRPAHTCPPAKNGTLARDSGSWPNRACLC